MKLNKGSIVRFLTCGKNRNSKKRTFKQILSTEVSFFNYDLKFGEIEKKRMLDSTASYFNQEGLLLLAYEYVSMEEMETVLLYQYNERKQRMRVVAYRTSEKGPTALQKIKARELFERTFYGDVVYQYDDCQRILSITGELHLLNPMYEKGYKCCYQYNKKGSEAKVYNAEGQYIFSLIYGTTGLLLRKQRFVGERHGRSFDEYVYNRQLQLLKVVKRGYRSSSIKEKYTYNEFGDSVTSFNSMARYKQSYQYRYDEEGSWIEQMDAPAKDTVELHTSMGIVKERTLVYLSEERDLDAYDEALRTYVENLMTDGAV
ncbi:MAG: hypothetical protein RR206_03360 [Bacteroidaceae bacterium]